MLHDSIASASPTGEVRVSIGMPIYNGAAFLREAIDSLLAQTWTDFELIVSDNGSTDSSQAIVDEYAACDARVRYVRHEQNRGAAWNFNHVVELARGPYFKWAAADDLCAPTFLEKCVEVLDRDPGIVCCHSRSRRIDAQGRVLEHLGDPTDGLLAGIEHQGTRRRDAASPTAHRRFGDVLLSHGWATRCYGLIRTDQLRQTALMQPYYGYEKVTMAELALRGRFFDLPEVLFFYRYHPSASSQLTTLSAQQQFFAAASVRTSPRLGLLRGYLRAVSSAPISRRERLLCRAWIGRYLLQVEKWPHIAHAILTGLGLGNIASPTRGKTSKKHVSC